MRKLLLVVLPAMLAGVLITACASHPAPRSPGPVILDVRTPAEFASGHLEGAVNIDVTAPDFVDVIAGLPSDGSYVVYCRSGRRSARAAAMMREKGFTDVIDGGAIDQAAEVTGRAEVGG